MDIHVKVLGRDLFRQLYGLSSMEKSPFPIEFRQHRILWRFGYLLPEMQSEELLSLSDAPSVVVVDASNQHQMERLALMEKRMRAVVKSNPSIPLLLSPVIAVYDDSARLSNVHDVPDLVADWVILPLDIDELTRRILASLKRKKIFSSGECFGALVLNPDTRSVSYGDLIAHLTPSEYLLMEFFLGQMGSIVPIKDLMRFFKSSGKSAEASNIRVAIFQLRLKLEILTKSRVSLVNVYRRGYALRPVRGTEGAVGARADDHASVAKHQES